MHNVDDDHATSSAVILCNLSCSLINRLYNQHLQRKQHLQRNHTCCKQHHVPYYLLRTFVNFGAADSVKPVQVLGPHVASLGIKFYRWKQGSNFPKSYDRMAFIVQRGSWNRAVKIGYRVTMVKLDTKSDPPKAVMHKDFMWGWLQNKGDLENQYSWGE